VVDVLFEPVSLGEKHPEVRLLSVRTIADVGHRSSLGCRISAV
jgi:hypothetical protein